jgi:CheY-like chemotaxis protein
MTTISWLEDDHEEIAALVYLLEADNYVIKRYRTRNDVDSHIEEICQSDAILLDIILPPVIENEPHQGVSILRRLREELGYNKPVVVCSVVRAPGIIKELHKLGVPDEYILPKPVRPSVLTSIVKKALGQE